MIDFWNIIDNGQLQNYTGEDALLCLQTNVLIKPAVNLYGELGVSIMMRIQDEPVFIPSDEAFDALASKIKAIKASENLYQ